MDDRDRPDIDWEDLRRRSVEVAAHAYAPYSGLSVGAAGLTDRGTVVTGCNVENASFGLTLCAECGLVGDLHRSGGGRLIAVSVTGNGALLTPCGRCRQLLSEAGGPELLLDAEPEPVTLEALLPGAFRPEDLP
jgi:cytidine deaminase